MQVKLFHDWVGGWSPEERNKLLTLLKETDSTFGDSLDKSLAALDGGASSQEEQPLPQVPAEDEAPIDVAVVAEQQDAAAAPVAAAVAAVVANAAAPAPDSDIDEALESSPSSTLSSPRPGDGHPDSGLDSPTGGDVAEEDEDEGGHVIVMDDVIDGGVDAAADGGGAAALPQLDVVQAN